MFLFRSKIVMSLLILGLNLNSIYAQDTQPVDTAKNIIFRAQKVWSINKALDGESLLQTKKGAYCAMGEDHFDLDFLTLGIFSRTYQKANENTKILLRDAVLDNYAHIFLNQIGDKINYSYDWDNAQVSKITLGRGSQRVDGFEVKITTWAPQYNEMEPGKTRPTSSVIFEMKAHPSIENELSITDLVLAGIRVSGLYSQWSRDIQLGRKSIEEVLEAWSKENQPLCPQDTAPYRALSRKPNR
jgi:hypothetical protein